MLDLIKKISFTGIHPELSPMEVKQLKRINRLLLIAVTASICFTLIYTIRGVGAITLVWITALLIYSTCFFLNKLGFFRASVFLGIVCFILSTLGTAILS